ncbi:hypothetical protein BZA05DRAFT_169642 [Tricharina praecox]|uniref:uncharacterized protein n=1 Tax=Tricharina praecox TaxID=43433 RepID=UPI00221E809E|nr:uncharacterized protein BZA05DRAFT_169642 [Tricharina praecox]KAI5857259.1 hypothetical protein BZA05DRAFT_169642 [Tricharina praecox]
MTFRVFNSMIGPKSRFQEAIKLRRSYISGLGDPPVVVALDDDPDALEYIFNVLHHRQERLPEVDQPLMVAVAAICDKYELHSALQPVADRVFLPLGEIASEGYGDWLFIAYVFGYEDLFSKVSQEVILSNQETISTISVYTPQKVTEMLIAKRTLIVSQLVERLISIGYERMIKPGEPRPTVKCKATYSGDTMCEFLQFGHFVGTLASGRLLENIPNKILCGLS